MQYDDRAHPSRNERQMTDPLDQSPAPDGGATRRRDLGILALAVLAPIWGYGWVATKVGLQYSRPLTFAALRVALSALCLLAVLVLTRRSLRPPVIGYTIVIGLLQTSLFTGLVMWALSSAGAGKIAVLTYTMPFWLLLLAWGFLGERLRGAQWPAVGLAFAGLVLVITPWHIHGLLPSVLTIAGGLSWAASALVAKLAHRRHDIDVLSLTTWQMVFGALPLVAVAALTARQGPDWTPAFVASLTYNVLLANALAWFLWLYALHRLSAGLAGLGTLAIPVIGVVASWLQLGERPGAVESVGMALIVGGLALLVVQGVAGGRRRAAGDKEELVVQPVVD
jgi:drug/metabolite transporter (DMT)-like permease